MSRPRVKRQRTDAPPLAPLVADPFLWEEMLPEVRRRIIQVLEQEVVTNNGADAFTALLALRETSRRNWLDVDLPARPLDLALLRYAVRNDAIAVIWRLKPANYFKEGAFYQLVGEAMAAENKLSLIKRVCDDRWNCARGAILRLLRDNRATEAFDYWESYANQRTPYRETYIERRITIPWTNEERELFAVGIETGHYARVFQILMAMLHESHDHQLAGYAFHAVAAEHDSVDALIWLAANNTYKTYTDLTLLARSAANRSSMNVLNYILTSYSQAPSTRAAVVDTAAAAGARVGQLAVLAWAVAQPEFAWPSSERMVKLWLSHKMSGAVLDWLEAHGVRPHESWCDRLLQCIGNMGTGHVNASLLDWWLRNARRLFNNTPEATEDPAEWYLRIGHDMLVNPARGGDLRAALHVLKAHGAYPPPATMVDMVFGHWCRTRALHGTVPVFLQWLAEQGYVGQHMQARLDIVAANNDAVNPLRWLRTHGYAIEWVQVAQVAIKRRSLPVLNVAVTTNGFEWVGPLLQALRTSGWTEALAFYHL